MGTVSLKQAAFKTNPDVSSVSSETLMSANNVHWIQLFCVKTQRRYFSTVTEKTPSNVCLGGDYENDRPRPQHCKLQPFCSASSTSHLHYSVVY